MVVKVRQEITDIAKVRTVLVNRIEDFGVVEFLDDDRRFLGHDHEVDDLGRAGRVNAIARLGEGVEHIAWNDNDRPVFVFLDGELNVLVHIALMQALRQFGGIADLLHDRWVDIDDLVAFRDFLLGHPFESSVELGDDGVLSDGFRNHVAHGCGAIGSEFAETIGIEFRNDFGADEFAGQVPEDGFAIIESIEFVEWDFAVSLLRESEGFGGGFRSTASVGASMSATGVVG